MSHKNTFSSQGVLKQRHSVVVWHEPIVRSVALARCPFGRPYHSEVTFRRFRVKPWAISIKTSLSRRPMSRQRSWMNMLMWNPWMSMRPCGKPALKIQRISGVRWRSNSIGKHLLKRWALSSTLIAVKVQSQWNGFREARPTYPTTVWIEILNKVRDLELLSIMNAMIWKISMLLLPMTLACKVVFFGTCALWRAARKSKWKDFGKRFISFHFAQKPHGCFKKNGIPFRKKKQMIIPSHA